MQWRLANHYPHSRIKVSHALLSGTKAVLVKEKPANGKPGDESQQYIEVRTGKKEDQTLTYSGSFTVMAPLYMRQFLLIIPNLHIVHGAIFGHRFKCRMFVLFHFGRTMLTLFRCRPTIFRVCMYTVLRT